MLLPVAFSGSGVAWLAVRNQGIGVVDYRVRGAEPVACRLAVQINQKAITRSHINGETRCGICASGVIRQLRTVRGNECLQSREVGRGVLLIINLNSHT